MEEWKEKLGEIINHIKYTNVSDWCKDVVRTKDGLKNCLFGHVFNMGKDNKEANQWWDFMEMVATTYMVYPVNDGSHPKYKQNNPRDRCVAYLEDILSGEEKTTVQLMDEELTA